MNCALKTRNCVSKNDEFWINNGEFCSDLTRRPANDCIRWARVSRNHHELLYSKREEFCIRNEELLEVRECWVSAVRYDASRWVLHTGSPGQRPRNAEDLTRGAEENGRRGRRRWGFNGRILISCVQESWFSIEKCWFYNKTGEGITYYIVQFGEAGPELPRRYEKQVCFIYMPEVDRSLSLNPGTRISWRWSVHWESLAVSVARISSRAKRTVLS